MSHLAIAVSTTSSGLDRTRFQSKIDEPLGDCSEAEVYILSSRTSYVNCLILLSGIQSYLKLYNVQPMDVSTLSGYKEMVHRIPKAD
jgi:hypothetical protein